MDDFNLDDFNSSDIEFEPAPRNPLAHAGAHSVSHLLDRASELRVESKKASKQLQAVAYAPGTRYNNARWANAFDAFYTGVLKKQLDSMPNYEDIERFLLTAPETTESSYSSRTAIKWGTLANGLKCVIHSILCRHSSFKLTYGERERIKDVFETLRTQGKITKDPCHESQWLSTQLIAHLTRSLFEDAIRFGTSNWSVVVHKCLGLALQSALSCRSGDVVRSKYYEANECLTYQDVVLKVTQDPQTLSGEVPLLDRVIWEAKVTLRHTKGRKRDESRNHVVILSSLDDVQFNVVDPLKLLLVHALRQGGVQGATTAEEATQQALTRRDNVVIWSNPQRPVLCMLTVAGGAFDFTGGAPTSQLVKTLRQAAKLSGIEEVLRVHDIRRGAAEEASRLRPRRNTELAAQALDHTKAAKDSGITAKYIGHDRKSTLAERLSLESSNRFGVQPNPDQAGRTTAKRKRTALIDGSDHAQGKTPSIDTEDVQTKKVKKARDAETHDAEIDNAVIDPALLLVSGISAESNLQSPGEVSLAQSKQRELCEYLTFNPSVDHAQPQLLETAASQFIPWLSQINTRIPPQGAHTVMEDLRGGSRDEPTVFLFTCKYAAEGCSYSAPKSGNMIRHEKICTSEYRRLKADQQAQEEAGQRLHLACDTPGCDTIISAPSPTELSWSMKRHKKRACPTTSKSIISCEIGGLPECQGEFESGTTLGKHKRRYHSAISPQTCSISGCKSKRVWSRSSDLEGHLRNTHKIKGEELKDLLTAAKELDTVQ